MKAIKLLVICVLGAIAVVAAFAGDAQALTSEWAFGEELLSEHKLTEEKTSITGGPIKISAASLKVTIECQKALGSGKIVKGGTDELPVSLTECKVVELPSCKVSEPVTLKAKTEEIVAGEVVDYKVVPQAEETFATITLGKECALGEKLALKGTVAAEALLELSVSQPLTFSESISKTLNTALVKEGGSELKLTLGKAAAVLTGKLSIKLSGEQGGGFPWRRYRFTLLCEKRPAAGTLTCPTAQFWPKETALTTHLETGIPLNFKLGVTETTCESSVLSGKTSMDGDAPLTGLSTSFTFSKCNNGCAVSTEGSSRLWFQPFALPGDGSLEVLHTLLKFVCGAITCRYGLIDVYFNYLGDEQEPLLSAPGSLNMPLISGDQFGCTTGVWKGVGNSMNGGFRYIVESPTPSFITG